MHKKRDCLYIPTVFYFSTSQINIVYLVRVFDKLRVNAVSLPPTDCGSCSFIKQTKLQCLLQETFSKALYFLVIVRKMRRGNGRDILWDSAMKTEGGHMSSRLVYPDLQITTSRQINLHSSLLFPKANSIGKHLWHSQHWAHGISEGSCTNLMNEWVMNRSINNILLILNILCVHMYWLISLSGSWAIKHTSLTEAEASLSTVDSKIYR